MLHGGQEAESVRGDGTKRQQQMSGAFGEVAVRVGVESDWTGSSGAGNPQSASDKRPKERNGTAARQDVRGSANEWMGCCVCV